MAGIDYTIPQQFKGIQIESPINAMAQAMQLRQLQESSEMNALRRQDAQEAAQLRREELAFRTQEAKTKQEERQRVLSKEQLVEAVADLTSYDTVESVLAGVRQKVADGLVTQAQADKVLAGLPKNDFELPAWQIRTMRSLLPAKEQYAELKAARDAAYEDYATSETFAGRSPLPRQDWERRTAPAAAAPTVAPTAAPAPEAAPVAAPAPEAAQESGLMVTRGGTTFYDKPNLAAGDRPYTPGVAPTAETVPAPLTYDEYVSRALATDSEILPREAFVAQQQQQPALATSPANALVANVAPVNALVSPPAEAAVKEETVLPSVEKQGRKVGFEHLDPQAQALYELAARTRDKEKAATYRAAAKEIQEAHVAALKQSQLTGEFANVELARRKIFELSKNPTPENLAVIADLKEQIKAAAKGKGTTLNVGMKLPEQEKEFEKALGSGQAKDLLDSRTKAEDARDILTTAQQGREMLKLPIITGAGANFFVGLDQALKTAGMDFGGEASANAQAYGTMMASNTAKLIKNFGSGTGLSDADRKYAERMAAGDVTVDKRALEKILQLQEFMARKTIERHNKKAKGIKTNIPLEVEIDAENVTPQRNAPAPYSDAEKERRYQEYKAKQGGK